MIIDAGVKKIERGNKMSPGDSIFPNDPGVEVSKHSKDALEKEDEVPTKEDIRQASDLASRKELLTSLTAETGANVFASDGDTEDERVPSTVARPKPGEQRVHSLDFTRFFDLISFQDIHITDSHFVLDSPKNQGEEDQCVKKER